MVIAMKNPLLPLIKITSMTSLEIAELTKKNHSHVLRDIRVMLKELYSLDEVNPKLDGIDIKGICILFRENGQIESKLA